MYFRFERRYNLLQVDDTFARLKQVHQNGDLEFEFNYHISQREAVKRESMVVQVSVSSRTIRRKSITDTVTQSQLNGRQLVDNIRTQVIDAKTSIKQQEEFIVASRKSDISSKINNEILGQLRSSTASINKLSKPKLKLVSSADVKESNESRPVLHMSAHRAIDNVHHLLSSSLVLNAQAVMHDMITKQGVDPSHVTEMTHRSITAIDSIGGLLRKSRAPEVNQSSATQLLHHHVFPTDAILHPITTTDVVDSARVHVLMHEINDNVDVPITVIIPSNRRLLDGKDNSHFFVKFELIHGRTGLAIDTVTKPLDVARHVQLYFTPRKPPIVTIAKSEVSSRVNLEIKQLDRGATSVQVFKKNVFNSVTDIEDYTLMGTFNVRHNEQSLLVPVEMPRNSVAIYRVVPVGSLGTIGNEYTNVVIKPPRYRSIKAVALVAQSIETGILVEARKIPPNVVAIEFQVLNKTLFEKTYRNVSGDVIFIDDAAKTADHVTALDSSTVPGHVYEYVARLIYRDGSSERSGNATIEFNQPAPGRVDTRITNLSVSHTPEPTVRFNLLTEIVDTNQDIIKALLNRQDIFEQFKDDVMREREFLKNLIAHNVQRVDLTTGAREDFGVVTVLNFDDELLRKNQSIPPLKLGHKYRYEVTALLRSPESMFETLQKSVTDSITKKPYTFSPSKFMHPIALKRGVLVTTSGLKTRFSKEAMSHGAIGATESIEVSFDESAARVVDASAARFDQSLNVITWKLQGSIDQVDHFLIMKEVHGVRTIVGKAHSEFSYGNCQYLHQISKRDEGSLVYVIVPVFNDYKIGAGIFTNAVIV